MIFETHAHYDDEQFDKDREELLDSMEKNGIGTIVNIGSNMETSRWTVKAADKYPFLYGAVGVHPSDTGEMKTEDLAELKKYASNPKILAIGEIGLDYYWDEPERPIQKKWFEAQMELARETKLPMVIGGVVHCFSYPKEMARKFLDMGFYLGIGGVVTFKNSRTLKEVVSYAPLDRILLETDSPYLSPEPNRGKRNSSLNLPYVAEQIAALKGISTKEVIEVTEQNARNMYRMKEV